VAAEIEAGMHPGFHKVHFARELTTFLVDTDRLEACRGGMDHRSDMLTEDMMVLIAMTSARREPGFFASTAAACAPRRGWRPWVAGCGWRQRQRGARGAAGLATSRSFLNVCAEARIRHPTL